MKTLNAIAKILAVLAAVAGAVYLIAAYGDKIVAWAKRIIGCCPWDEGMEDVSEAPAETPAEAPAAEAPAEAPAAEPEEAPAASDEPVADEGDFEG